MLIFSLRPLYPAYADQPHRVFGLSPLHDQQLAGTRDDRRADPRARHVRRAPPPAGAPAAARAAASSAPGSRRDVSGAYRFSFEPVFLVLARRWPRCSTSARSAGRAPDERPAPGRVAVFALGLALVAVPVNSPLETLSAHYLLLAHLLQNALIADWGPPLLILGLTPSMRRGVARAGGRPLARSSRDPASRWSSGSSSGTACTSPLFYDWALAAAGRSTLEHALLLAAGLVFWWPVLGEPRRLGSLGALAYLGIAFITAPWLSLAYIFASSPFYSFYEHAAPLGALADPRPEPRRDPDERGADEHHLRRVRLGAPARARRGGGGAAAGRRRLPRRASLASISMRSLRDKTRALLLFTPWASVPLALLACFLVAATPVVVLVPYGWVLVPLGVLGARRAGAVAAPALPHDDPGQLAARRLLLAAAP